MDDGTYPEAQLISGPGLPDSKTHILPSKDPCLILSPTSVQAWCLDSAYN
jgi:hypothetical protein